MTTRDAVIGEEVEVRFIGTLRNVVAGGRLQLITCEGSPRWVRVDRLSETDITPLAYGWKSRALAAEAALQLLREAQA